MLIFVFNRRLFNSHLLITISENLKSGLNCDCPMQWAFFELLTVQVSLSLLSLDLLRSDRTEGHVVSSVTCGFIYISKFIYIISNKGKRSGGGKS